MSGKSTGSIGQNLRTMVGAAIVAISLINAQTSEGGILKIGTKDAQECIEACRGVGYDCTINNFNPATGICTIETDAEPTPQRVFVSSTSSEQECKELARAAGEQGSWDPATKACTIGLAYIGCFKENETGIDPHGPSGRVLNGSMHPRSGSRMTNNECVSFCGAKGFRYAGTQYGSYCFCGNKVGSAAQEQDCNMDCSGDPHQKCGDSYRNSIYLTHGSGGFTGAAPGYVGCFAENPDADTAGLKGRVLGGAMIPDDPAMTTAKCINFCKGGGWMYAGTQYAKWCFCGNSYENYGISPNCNMTCSGAPEEICGGAWANSVYKVK